MTYSHLNYSDDYDLDVVASTTPSGGKILHFTPTRHKLDLSVRIQGQLLAESVSSSVIFGSVICPIITENCTYHGQIGLTESYNVDGKSSYLTESVYPTHGKMSEPTVVEMLVEGKKDYTKVITYLEEFIKTPSNHFLSKEVLET